MACARRKEKSVKRGCRSSDQPYVICSRAIRTCSITRRSLLPINFSRSIRSGNKLVLRLSESSYLKNTSPSSKIVKWCVLFHSPHHERIHIHTFTHSMKFVLRARVRSPKSYPFSKCSMSTSSHGGAKLTKWSPSPPSGEPTPNCASFLR
jgi:hypothetical protein